MRRWCVSFTRSTPAQFWLIPPISIHNHLASSLALWTRPAPFQVLYYYLTIWSFSNNCRFSRRPSRWLRPAQWRDVVNHMAHCGRHQSAWQWHLSDRGLGATSRLIINSQTLTNRCNCNSTTFFDSSKLYKSLSVPFFVLLNDNLSSTHQVPLTQTPPCCTKHIS